MSKSLTIEPLAVYVEHVRDKQHGNMATTAEYFGVSVRHFSRYFRLDASGSIVPKIPAIPLVLADSMLSHAGDEALHTLWGVSELDTDYHLDGECHPRCQRCGFELIKPRKLCGFCIEETTGRTITFRQRELY